MKNYLRYISSILMVLSLEVGADTLSYSGRLTNGDGSPVTGSVDLKFELAYSNATGAILCTSDVNGAQLTNGVFHAKLNFICPTSSLYEVLGNVPVGQEAVLRVINQTASKTYSFQSLNPVPFAQMAHQLPKMNANLDQVLTWTGSKWEPKTVAGATGGTVTSVATGSGLTGGPFTTTGTISIENGGVTDSHLAAGISRAKLAGGTPNYVIVNDGSGVLSQVAQLPLAQGGTGANTAAAARTNLGLGTAAEANIGYSAGQVMPGNGVPVCTAFEKLQFTGLGPTYWACALDNDSADASKLPLTGGTMSGVINMNNNFIVGVRSPSDPGDAANKAYVDAQVSGSSYWTSSAPNLSYGLGNVVVGSSSPVTKLVVDGGVKISTEAAACAGSYYGTLRYNSNNIEYCDNNIWKKLDGTYDLAACPANVSSYPIGTKILCSCTAAATSSGTISGTGIYTEDSNPCRAAVHAGALVAATGGQIYILVGPGLSNGANSYIASTQNGITSSSFGNLSKSYTIIGSPTSNSGWYRGNANMSYSSGNVGIGNTSPAEKLDVTGNIALTGGLKLQSNSTNYVTLLAPASLGANINYTWPLTAPSNGQILSSTAAGVLSWINPPSAITTVFGRTGAVTATAGDYNASLVTNSPSGNISSSTVQAALNELDTEKQSADATLTSLAAYNTNGILVQTATDTFTGRSLVGVTNRTNITNGNGVSGNPTIDVSTTLLPSPVAGDVGKFLKATAADTSVWTALSSGDITTALGFTPINKAGDTIASGTLEFNAAGILKLTNNPINLTDAANKQYVDTQISTATNQWTAASGNVYRNSGNVGIGTNSPNVPLAIGGSLFTNTSNQIHIVNSGAFSRIAFGEDINNYGEMVWSDISDHISFNTKRAGTTFSNALVVRDDKVGIGTATPGSALDITKTDPIIRIKNTGGDIGGMFLMNSVNAGWLGMFNPTTTTAFGVIPVSTSKAYLGWDNSGKIGTVSNTFTTGNPGAPVYRNLLDDGSGKMGIGTTSPSEKLDVSGTATMNASTEGASTYVNSAASYTIPDSSLNIRRITLTGNATISLPAFAPTATKVYTLTVFLKQDAIGSRTANFVGNGADTVKWDSGSAPSVSLTANKITIVQFTKPSDETVWYGSKVWQED
ncbi:LCCL domain-containing protein [Peredibacter sp. HCB2-198]|uniref:LCCL domain-containing protein n=1 Tax=Peredibacter sp. HCB2-198 TaxID=3383025 RepID=UPI0038B539F6